jgi:hypothetical protein
MAVQHQHQMDRLAVLEEAGVEMVGDLEERGRQDKETMEEQHQWVDTVVPLAVEERAPLDLLEAATQHSGEKLGATEGLARQVPSLDLP